MKIYRRIFGKISDNSMKSTLENILKEDLGFSYFSKDVDENSTEYAFVKKYIEPFNLTHDIIGTKFSNEEILNAEVLCFIGARPFAYPQPEDPRYLANTYADSCNVCGTFGEQVAEFLIKKEPALKTNSLVSLHWVLGELFCTVELYKEFFQKLGLGIREVKVVKTGKTSKVVIQLQLPVLDSALEIENLAHTVCPKCNRIKYIPTTTGYFPKPRNANFLMAGTQEFFGSGHAADHRILLTNSVMKEMLKMKIAKIHQFVPCKNDLPENTQEQG